MDLVIPLRSGPNEEFRYALRSWDAHLQFNNVWVIGRKLDWFKGVRFLRTSQAGSKYTNTTLALKTACMNDAISEQFIYLNDDIFVMQTFSEIQAYHRGTLRDFTKNQHLRGQYLAGAKETLRLLDELGHDNPLCYELHVPMVIDRKLMLKALHIGEGVRVLHKRSFYANLVGLGGQRFRDPKVSGRQQSFKGDQPFLSTSDQSFKSGQVGRYIRAKFTKPSRFEGN